MELLSYADAARSHDPVRVHVQRLIEVVGTPRFEVRIRQGDERDDPIGARHRLRFLAGYTATPVVRGQQWDIAGRKNARRQVSGAVLAA